MHKPNVSKFIKDVSTSVSKHSPEILTGLGIAGMITTTIFAVKATPKALSNIEKEKDRQNRELRDEAEKNGLNVYPEITKLRAVDVIKVTWKCYLPSVILCTTSVACLIGANQVHLRRNAALATAYKLSETALTEYKEKVVETIGEKKEREIRDELSKDHVEENPVSKNNVIITGKGNSLCYDYYSKRYFKSDIDKIKKAVNEINRRMLIDSYVSINDFYDEIGLEGIKPGDKLGWNTDMRLIDLHFSAQLTEDGESCIVIDFDEPPKYNFDRFF